MMRKKLSLGAIVITIGLIVGFAVLSRLTHKQANIMFKMSPSVAAAILDGKKKVSPGAFYASPGKHTLTARFDGFSDRTVSFTALSKSVQNVYLVLIPDSQVGYDWITNHPEEANLRQSIGGTTFNTAAQTALRKYPFIADLPLVDNFYRIDYGASEKNPNDTTAIAVYITYYSEAGKQSALQWLQYKGFTPNNIEVIYIDKTSYSSSSDS